MSPRLLKKLPSQPIMHAAPARRTVVVSPMAGSFDFYDDDLSEYEDHVPLEANEEPLFHDSFISSRDYQPRQKFERPPSPPNLYDILGDDTDGSDYGDAMEEQDFEWDYLLDGIVLARVVQVVRLGRPQLVDIPPRRPALTSIYAKERGHVKQLSQASTVGSSSTSSSISRSPSISTAATDSEESQPSPASSVYDQAKTPDDYKDKSFFHDDWQSSPTYPISEYCDQMFDGISPKQEVNRPFRKRSTLSKMHSFSRPLQIDTTPFKLQQPPPQRTSSILRKAPPTPLSAKSPRASTVEPPGFYPRGVTGTMTPPQSPDTPNRKRVGGIWSKRSSLMSSAAR